MYFLMNFRKAVITSRMKLSYYWHWRIWMGIHQAGLSESRLKMIFQIAWFTLGKQSGSSTANTKLPLIYFKENFSERFSSKNASTEWFSPKCLWQERRIIRIWPWNLAQWFCLYRERRVAWDIFCTVRWAIEYGYQVNKQRINIFSIYSCVKSMVYRVPSREASW